MSRVRYSAISSDRGRRLERDWMAVSILWHDVESRAAPQAVSQPFRRRFGGELDHAVCSMPCQCATPLRRRTGSHRRATAIDDTKNCQKPVFANLGVSSSDLFHGGIEVGMGGPGRIPQWKRKPGTGPSQEGLLTRPADKRSPGLLPSPGH